MIIGLDSLFVEPLFFIIYKKIIVIKVSCAIRRILQFNEAIVYGPIKFLDNNGIDVTNTCLFSWSNDTICWTEWVNYTTYKKIAKNIESDFYLRILFDSSLGKVSINNMETKCYTVCLYNSNPFLEDLCTENLFNPYVNLDCALQLQQQLANSVICMLGIPIYYFRVLPQKDTADYSFKEYVMHNVESVKQMKMMIQDGTMPSSKPQFTDLDFDWEVDWEVELSKSHFAQAFGDTSFPKQRDFIYVPMMNRMWEVNSAYDEKNEGLMWKSTTWKLGLIKWNEKTNVEQGNFEDFIDNLVINTYDNVFAELEENEQARTTATTQLERPQYTANNIDNVFIQDAIRKQMTKNTIKIVEKQYNHGSIIVAKNLYELQEQRRELGNGEFEIIPSLITYQKGYCGEEGTLSFIIDTSEQQNDPYKQYKTTIYRTIISFGNIRIETDGKNIKFGDAIASLTKGSTDYLVICKWNRKSFVQEIVAYPYVVPSNLPSYRIKPEMYKFDLSIIEENGSCEYNNDNISEKQQEVLLIGNENLLKITNIKLINKYLNKEQAIKESLKYTTTYEGCVFNDLARPLDTGEGYSIK